MEIQVFYAEKIGVPFQEFDSENSNYDLVWEGTSADLEIYKFLEDENLLEIIFNKFNIDGRPKNFPHDARALSIGDVVSLDYRSYLCDTQGWKRLENFNLSLKP
ncbi:MAG TPA: YodL domain-containing protein [Pyrinomonadaceae bacterium]|nr:YodL domain-containing protein [Pyrinomonadaceae bacterium]